MFFELILVSILIIPLVAEIIIQSITASNIAIAV